MGGRPIRPHENHYATIAIADGFFRVFFSFSGGVGGRPRQNNAATTMVVVAAKKSPASNGGGEKNYH